jgi:hypothetical protein
MQSNMKPLDIDVPANANRPDSARASGRRQLGKFEAVWENDIKLDLPEDANPDAPPDDNRKSMS